MMARALFCAFRPANEVNLIENIEPTRPTAQG
jgi:hypothetical protein